MSDLKENRSGWQAVKFFLFSTSAGIIEIISFTIMTELTDFTYWPCYLVALTLSVVYNFTVNRRFTFKSVANVPVAMLKVLCFYLVFTPVTTYLGHIADTNGVNEYIILGVTMCFNLSLEFLYCKFVVYRGKINTNSLYKGTKK